MTGQHGFLRRAITKSISRLPLPPSVDDFLEEVAGGAAAALLLRVVGVGLGFVFNVVLARFIGAEGVGIYYQAFAVVSFATVISQLGLDNALLRFVAASAGQHDWSAVRGVVRRSVLASSVLSVIVTIGVVVKAELIADLLFSAPEVATPLRLLSFAVLPLSLGSLHAVMLRAIERVEASVLVASVLVPFAQLGLLLLLVKPFALNGAVAAYVLAACGVLGVAALLWQRATPHAKRIGGAFSSRLLIKTAWPLFGIALLNSVRGQMDIVLLGAYADSASVGIYGAAKRVAMLASFILVAINMIVAPKFAVLHAQGEKEALALLAQRVTRLTMLLAVPVLVPLVVLPGPILSLFGDEFVAGSLPLVIMGIGEFVNMATGSVGYLLIMTGNGTAMRNTILVSTVLIIALSITLIPWLGATGAALASAAGLIVMNVAATVLVYRKLSILILPLTVKSRPVH